MSNQHLEALTEAIGNDDEINSTAIFIDGFSKDRVNFIEQIRKQGILRASRYDFRARTIKKTISTFLQQTYPTPLPREVTLYLESVLSLLYIAFSVHSIYKNFLRNLTRNDLKTYLASVEWLFWQHHVKEVKPIKVSYLDFSKEEIATGFSFFYLHFCHKFELNDVFPIVIDTVAMKKGKSLNILYELSKIISFKECEVLIDCFNYKAIRKKSNIIIEPPCPRLEQAMKLGYCHQESQGAGDYHRFYANYKTISLMECVTEFTNCFSDEMFCIKNTPARRVVMQLPRIEELKKIMTMDSLFREEFAELSVHAKELLLTKEQIEETPIYENLTIIDVIKFERLIRFLHWSFEKFIKDSQLQDSPLFLQSLLPVSVNDSGLIEILEFLFGKEKANNLLDLLSWKPSSETVFDLQYSPIIRCEKWAIFPLALISQTNLIRNLLQQIRFRFDANSDVDPVGDVLEKHLKPHASHVSRDLLYHWGKQEGEVDVLALIDKTMFVFECKNSLHPCSFFELRTSYDHIKKAGKQLTKFRRLFQIQGFRNYLSRKIGHKNLDSVKIITCIAMGNKMFSGWQEQGHPVRPIHELCSLISGGTIGTHAIQGLGDVIDLGQFRIWKEQNFKAEDLENYLIANSLHALQFNSMIPVEKGIQIRGKKLIRKSFALNLEKLNREFKKSFPFEKLTDERN